MPINEELRDHLIAREEANLNDQRLKTTLGEANQIIRPSGLLKNRGIPAHHVVPPGGSMAGKRELRCQSRLVGKGGNGLTKTGFPKSFLQRLVCRIELKCLKPGLSGLISFILL